ncbi:MAG: RNA methyltransferase [Actinomycetota bacterium]|nr:RNA methyltransferase [Actinomycetota bacterium]
MRDRRYRDVEGLVVIEGPRPLRTAIEIGVDLQEVFYRPDQEQISVSVEAADANFYEVDAETLDEIADSSSPQGVLAIAKVEETAVDDIAAMQRVVVIDSVQDPGNVGAIVRTAAAAQFDAVITTPGTADLWSPRAIRASAGTLFALNVARRVDLGSTLDLLREAGHVIFATDSDGSVSINDIDVAERMTLMLGSEAHGVSKAVGARTDAMIRVPMGPFVESLNVAVAAGIMMYRMQQETPDE